MNAERFIEMLAMTGVLKTCKNSEYITQINELLKITDALMIIFRRVINKVGSNRIAALTMPEK